MMTGRNILGRMVGGLAGALIIYVAAAVVFLDPLWFFYKEETPILFFSFIGRVIMVISIVGCVEDRNFGPSILDWMTRR